MFTQGKAIRWGSDWNWYAKKLKPLAEYISKLEGEKLSWIRGGCNMQTHFLFSSHTPILKIIPDSTRLQRLPAETGGSDLFKQGGFQQGKSLKNKAW